MNPLDRISNFLSHTLAAGIAGGFVFALVRNDRSFFNGLSAIFVGALASQYLTPVAISWGGRSFAEFPFSLGFLIGASGWLVAKNAISLLTEFTKRPFLPSPTALAAFLDAYNSRKKKTDDSAE